MAGDAGPQRARATVELMAGFTATLERLRQQVDAARVTLRLDLPEHGFHVDDVVTEAAARGVASLRGHTSIDQRAAGTIKWLERHRSILVQDDLRGADPAPPAALTEVYGATAQMLGPVVLADALVGWVSIHHGGGPRAWQPHEIAALAQAVALITRELAADQDGRAHP